MRIWLRDEWFLPLRTPKGQCVVLTKLEALIVDVVECTSIKGRGIEGTSCQIEEKTIGIIECTVLSPLLLSVASKYLPCLALHYDEDASVVVLPGGKYLLDWHSSTRGSVDQCVGNLIHLPSHIGHQHLHLSIIGNHFWISQILRDGCLYYGF